MTTIKSCLLCHSQCEIQNTNYPNLYKVCRKFLHYTLITQTEEENVCGQCFESAMQLAELSDQLKFLQKQLSELVWIFSLDILHRRRKTSENDGDSGKKVIEFNAADIPNCDSWNIPSSISEITTDQLLTPNYSLTEIEATESITIEEIKSEANELVLVDEEICHDSYGQHMDLASTETAEPNAQCITMNGQGPVLKLSKLQFQGGGRKIVVETEKQCNHQQGKAIKTEWIQNDSGSGYKMFNLITEVAPIAECSATSSKQAVVPPETMSSTSNEVICTKVKSSREIVGKNSSNKQSKYIKKFIDRAKKNALSKQQFPCGFCKKMFNRRGNMIRHKKRIHEKELPFDCDFCRKKFADKFSVTRHRMQHTGERPCKCSLCPKSFIDACSLKYHHQKTHSKEFPFKCSLCDKGFVRHSYLVDHLKSHQRKTLYECELCDYKTYNSQTFQLHKDANKCNFNFKCKECDEKFSTPELVEQHYKQVHFALDFTDECVIHTNT